MKIKRILFLLFLSFFLTGCPNKEQQGSNTGAKQITDPFQVPLNSRDRTIEQQHIDDRIRVTSDPTKIMWMHLVNYEGKMYKRLSVRTKITSSNKRNEPKTVAPYKGTTDYYPNSPFKKPGENTFYKTNEFLGPDGTFGKSDEYVYWFDAMGRYHQKGNGYLLTDYPIDMSNQVDDITGMYNMHLAAKKWQDEQEKELVKKEEKYAEEKREAEKKALIIENTKIKEDTNTINNELVTDIIEPVEVPNEVLEIIKSGEK